MGIAKGWSHPKVQKLNPVRQNVRYVFFQNHLPWFILIFCLSVRCTVHNTLEEKGQFSSRYWAEICWFITIISGGAKSSFPNSDDIN